MSKCYDKELPVTVNVIYGGRQSGKTYREFKKLEEENKALKDDWDDIFKKWESQVKRIGKAIKYVEHIDDFDIKDFRREELLKILRGEEK